MAFWYVLMTKKRLGNHNVTNWLFLWRNLFTKNVSEIMFWWCLTYVWVNLSCKPVVAGSIPGFSQSVGWDFKLWPYLLRCFKTRTTAGEHSGAPGHKTTKSLTHPASTGYNQGTRPKTIILDAACQTWNGLLQLAYREIKRVRVRLKASINKTVEGIAIS